MVGEESLAVPHTHQMLEMAFEDTAQLDSTHRDILQLPEPPGRKRLDLPHVPLVTSKHFEGPLAMEVGRQEGDISD